MFVVTPAHPRMTLGFNDILENLFLEFSPMFGNISLRFFLSSTVALEIPDCLDDKQNRICITKHMSEV